MNILYVNHTGSLGGAERSLLDLLAGLPSDLVVTVACPDGPFAAAVEGLGVARAQTLREIHGGARVAVRHTPRTVARLAADALVVRRAVQWQSADLVHANSIRAGLVAVAAGAPTIVSIRDCLPPGIVSSLTKLALQTRTAALVANSSYTASTFGLSGAARSYVIHPPIDLARFDPGRLSRTEARKRLALPADAHVLGVIGQISPWKGQDDAVAMLPALRRQFPDVRLLLVGKATFTHPATRFDNSRFESELREQASCLGVADAVEFLGEREDVPEVLRALDILLCPSWEEPFGRAVVEAMAMEVPVLCTSVGGPTDVVTDDVNGVLLEPRNPSRWSQVAAELLADGDRRARLGHAGVVRARVFSRDRHVAALLGVYAEVLARPGQKRTGLQ